MKTTTMKTTSSVNADNPALRYEAVTGFYGLFADPADFTDENRTSRLDASTVCGSHDAPETEVCWVRVGIDNEWGKADVYLRPDEFREYVQRLQGMLDG